VVHAKHVAKKKAKAGKSSAPTDWKAAAKKDKQQAQGGKAQRGSSGGGGGGEGGGGEGEGRSAKKAKGGDKHFRGKGQGRRKQPVADDGEEDEDEDEEEEDDDGANEDGGGEYRAGVGDDDAEEPYFASEAKKHAQSLQALDAKEARAGLKASQQAARGQGGGRGCGGLDLNGRVQELQVTDFTQHISTRPNPT
jgi:hypothetical protein